MERSTQIGIVLLVLLAILIGAVGGAVTGGIAGYYIAQQSIAEIPSADPEIIAERVEAILEDGAPTVDANGAPTASTALLEVTGSESDAMVAAVQQVAPAVVTVINRTSQGTGSGSGVIISDDGYIITNDHVVDGSRDLVAVFADGSRQDARLIGSDPLSDIAVIQVEGAVPTIADIGDSTLLQPGERVLAIGSPLGNFRNTVTSGVVSALNRSVPGSGMEGLIQTDTAINQGNSGGPLINLRGEVVGINTLVVRGQSFLSGDQAEGLGFAVPSEIFSNVSAELIANGEIKYPYLGIVYMMIDGEIAAENNLPVQNGAWISGGSPNQSAVVPGTPADRAGLQEDDVIVAIDGVSLAQGNSLRQVLLQYRPGDEVALTVVRNGEELTLSVVLGTRPADLEP